MAGLYDNLPYTNFHELNLGWLVNTVKVLADKYEELDIEGTLEDLNQAITGNTEAIASLNTRFAALENGAYIENYIPALASWINANLQEVIARVAKFVFFGITDDGYFYVDIPESWSDVQFSTGLDPNKPDEYLHLILTY